MLRQQRKHFAAMLSAAILASREFFWPQLLAVNDVWNKCSSSDLLWHTIFHEASRRTKKFSGKSRDSLLNFLDELRIKTRHVNHPGEDASNERAANQTRRTNRRSGNWEVR